MVLNEEILNMVVEDTIRETFSNWFNDKSKSARDMLKRTGERISKTYDEISRDAEPYTTGFSNIVKNKMFINKAKGFSSKNSKFLSRNTKADLQNDIKRSQDEVAKSENEIKDLERKKYYEYLRSRPRPVIGKEAERLKQEIKWNDYKKRNAGRMSINGRPMTDEEYDEFWKNHIDIPKDRR